MVNEIGIRKYIRMLLEQRPEKVGFGNAPNQNQFSVATKPSRFKIIKLHCIRRFSVQLRY
jgi:hypothetical protein